jgi:hypothetical protein
MRALAAILCLLTIAESTRADVNSITPDPSPTLGNMLTCTALNDGKPPTVNGWIWSVQLVYNGHTSPVGCQDQGGGTVWIPATTPGLYVITCTVSYASHPPNPPPAPKTLTVDITVSPPDSVELVSGVPVMLDYTQSTTVLWKVLAGGNVCGQYLVGLAQEQLTNRIDWQGNRLKDTLWQPLSPLPTFHLGVGRIADVNAIVPGSWPAIQVGETNTYDQELRIFFQYPNLEDHQESSLGIKH